LAAVLLGRAAIANALQGTATRSIVADPARALNKANASLKVDAVDVQSYYVKAAALARLGRADAARAALVSALDQEPDNHVTWAILGDLDVRRRAFAQASDEYRRAAELDPMDANSDAGIPGDPHAAAQFAGPGPVNVGHRPHMVNYEIIKDTSPLELARALGAPGLHKSDEVIVGLFGYGVG
jgi:tetratricopeptide (TPR) repeat protein